MSDVAPADQSSGLDEADRRPHEFLVTREVAELLRTPESTVRYWRHIRTGPASLKAGRRVLYRREAVFAWLRAQETNAPEMGGEHPWTPTRPAVPSQHRSRSR